MSKVYVGDTGTAIVLDCGQDVSSATARAIEVRKPDGALTSWAATAGGSTEIRYLTLSNTLDMPGDWTLQAKVTLPSGMWLGETVVLRVYAPFA